MRCRPRLLACSAATVEDRRGPCAAHDRARRAESAREWTPSGDFRQRLGMSACRRTNMRPKTVSALAVTGALLAVPAAWAAPDNPLRHPVGDHVTVAAQMRAEARDNRRQDLARHAFRVARRVAHGNGERFHAQAERRRLHGLSARELRARMRRSCATPATAPPPPRSRRSPPASPAATRRPTPATGSTGSTSSPSRPGGPSAAAATPPAPPRLSRTAAPRSCTRARAPRPGRSAAARQFMRRRVRRTSTAAGWGAGGAQPLRRELRASRRDRRCRDARSSSRRGLCASSARQSTPDFTLVLGDEP